MSHQTNIVRIKAVANLLQQLNKDFVFVGGATVSLYGNEDRTESRPTDDVDVVIELATYSGYAALDEKLRKVGFQNDSDFEEAVKAHLEPNTANLQIEKIKQIFKEIIL